MIIINKKSAKLWLVDHWVRFKINENIYYDNIIIFLENQNISFLNTVNIDFSSIPLELHGNGRSNNLLEYLANNNNNNLLIEKFLNYFLSEIFDVRYYNDNSKILFYFSGETWQKLKIVVNTNNPPIPPEQSISVANIYYTPGFNLVEIIKN